jgi:hypothetical protein
MKLSQLVKVLQDIDAQFNCDPDVDFRISGANGTTLVLQQVRGDVEVSFARGDLSEPRESLTFVFTVL